MLQFKRARIKVRQVVWPALFLVLAAVVLLAVFTSTGDFNWERIEIDDLTGESIGRCKGEHSLAFFLPGCLICLVPTVLTCVMAWKTSDVEDVYSESKWIFSLVLAQLQVKHVCCFVGFIGIMLNSWLNPLLFVQVIIVGAPVVAILQDVSTNGRYIGLTLLVWTFPMSTMGLIMVPKMMMVRREARGFDKGSKTRGSRAHAAVTGIENHPDAATEPSSNAGMNSTRGLSPPQMQTVTME